MLILRNPIKFWEEYKALIIFIGLVFSLLILSLYFASPSSDPKTVIKYPYVLGVSPQSALTGSQVVVYFDTAEKLPLSNSLNLSVINPFGTTIRTVNPLLEPNISVVATSQGTYNVILSNDTNGNMITSTDFEVFSHTEHYFAFMTGIGFPMTIGIVITGIATIYDFAFTRLTDRKRKLDDKAKWTIDNSRYYMKLVRSAFRIANCFAINGLSKTPCERIWLDSSKYKSLVDAVLDFKNAHDDMLEYVGFYYFDDVKAEDFLGRLSRYILKVYEDFGIEDLRQPSRSPSHMPVKSLHTIQSPDINAKVEAYFGPIYNRHKDRIKQFYCSHLLYCYALYAAINDEAVVTYSMPKHLEKTFNHWITNDRDCLSKALKHFNNEFFGENKKLNYKLSVNDRDFLKEVLGINRVILTIIGLALAFIIGILILFVLFL